MANKIVLKKSSIPSKVPLVTDLEYGELALNYKDGKLYFKNATNAIQSFDSDTSSFVTLTGTQTLTNKTLTSPTIIGGTLDNVIIGGTTPTTITGTDVSATGILKSLNSVGDEGGEIQLAKAQTNTTLSGNVTIDVYQNKLRIFEAGGTNRGVYIDLTSANTGVGSDLLGGAVGVTSVDGNTGTVTAAQLLTAIKKEDGSGSGLDADLLDGLNTSSTNAVSTVMTRDSSGLTGIGGLNLDTAYSGASAVGRLNWNGGEGTAEIGLKGGNVTLQIGQEMVVLAYNGTGSTIADGKVVAISGAQGQRPSIILADADSESLSAYTLGIATESIANGAEGFVTTFGVVRGINTSAFTEGAAVFLSQTAGGLTSTRPVAPAHTVFIGYVIKSHASSGEIFVNINNGWELGELHDVYINTVADGNLLKYNSANSRWENATQASITSGDSDKLDGQHGSYYLDWTNVTNKPDPVITLAGDLSGSVTLTDLASGTLTATIAANSVALGTDTTGNYLATLASSGNTITVTGSGSESAAVNIDLPNSGVTAGSYGSSTAIPVISVDAQGRITTASTSSITVGDGALTLATSGVGLSGSASFSANQSTGSTFTVTSNATSSNTASTIVARDASGNFTAGTITATLSGNASTVTNGVYTTGSYADPAWITSLAKSKVGLGNVENTALSTWAGSTNITTIGAATASSLTVTGDLTVNGSVTTINSTTISVDDKNIELGSVVTPTNTTADGGGITLKGATDKTFNWVNSTSAWTSSEHLALAAGKDIILNGLTSGSVTLVVPDVAGSNTITFPAVTGNVVTTGDTGTVTNTMLAGSIANAKLTNSSITVNGTAISLGSSGTITATATNALTIGSYLTGTSYNGSSAVTIAVDATNLNTASKVVARDASGNFSAGTITAALSGNATTATTLATSRNINGVAFNGSADITITAANPNALTIGTGLSGTSYNGSAAVTIALASGYGDTQNPYASKTANYFLAAPNGAAGAPTFRAIVAADIPTLNQNTTGSAATLTTARTLTIGSTGKTFNGSADVSWSLTEIGALGASAKAADSELIDGIDSTRLVYGSSVSGSNNASATQNVYELAQYKSGFWDVSNGAWAPTTTGWYWGATFAHASNSASYNYSGQLAFLNGGGGDNVYARTIGGGTPSSWSKLLSSGNYTSYAVPYNYASTTNVSLTWGATAGQILRNENSELAIGLEDTNPFALYIQGRTSTSAARDIVLNPLGGNIGIGTQAPVDVLDVSKSKASDVTCAYIRNPNDTGGAALRIKAQTTTPYSLLLGAANAGGQMQIGSETNHDVAFITNNTEKMRATAGGYFGIGTQAPACRAHIKGTWVNGEGILQIDADSGTQYSGLTMQNNGTVKFYVYNDNTNGYNYIGSSGTEPIVFGYNSTSEWMRLNSTGLGVGTNNPQNKLSVAGTLGISETGATGNRLLLSTSASGAIINQNDNSPMSLQILGTTAVRIAANQNVAIGYTTDQSYKLAVNGSFAATTKSFVIDHPTKEGKKLRYGSLEGPENGVYVRGKLKGSSVIELPEYWTKLVDPDSITVNLTCIGKYQKLYVMEIKDNKVYVGNENLWGTDFECFYTVYGERCDVEKLEVEID